jgi:hypothetical protein
MLILELKTNMKVSKLQYWRPMESCSILWTAGLLPMRWAFPLLTYKTRLALINFKFRLISLPPKFSCLLIKFITLCNLSPNHFCGVCIIVP